jgi:hypothetical protein
MLKAKEGSWELGAWSSGLRAQSTALQAEALAKAWAQGTR